MERAAGKYEFSPAFKERLAFYRQNNIAVVFILAYDNKIAYPPTSDDPCRNINPEAFGRYAAARARLLRESGVRFVLMVTEAVKQVKAFDPTIQLLSDEDCTILHYGKTPGLWITEFGCPVRENVNDNVTFELGSASEEGLAAILVRAFIGAEAAGVKAMTWFSFWDGPDGPMGLLAKDGRKRKSYYAFETMSQQLGEYTLVQQVAGGGHLTTGVQAYLFRKAGDWKLVAWAIDGPTWKLALTGALREAQAKDVLGGMVDAGNDSAGVRQLELGMSPLYLSGVRGEEPVEECFRRLEFLSTAGVSQAYSTTFDGDEDPLSEGGKWINNGLDWTKICKHGGIAYGTQTGTNKGIYRYDDSYAHLSGFPPDQEAWAQVQIAKPDPSCHQELEILLRWTSSAHSTTGYECFARCLNDDSSYLQIVRWEGPLGKFTYLADKRGANYGLKNGDTLKASIIGNVITVYINGVEKAQVKDDTHKTGNPGIGAFLSCDNGRGIGSSTDFGFTSFTARGLGRNQRTNPGLVKSQPQ